MRRNPHKAHSLAVLVVFALAGVSACKGSKDKGKDNSGDPATTAPKGATAAVDQTPVKGIPLDELDPDLRGRFDKLVDSLPSPCGKSHSLRTSRNTDESCTKATFAVNYVFEMLKDGATDSEVRSQFASRYGETPRETFTLNPEMPHVGPTDAKVKVVEFFDYGCPACKMMKPMLEEAIVGYETDVVLYYRQFPLGVHADSQEAAQAALAAAKQGKFHEMHDLLFADQASHKRSDLEEHAKAIGLDLTKFDSDYTASKAAVDFDHDEGQRAHIDSTPSVFINGQLYTGPAHPKYFRMWLDEALTESP